jgi:thymidylate synthase (FAD)
MKINLLQNTALDITATAIRTCWQSFDKSDHGGEKDLKLIDRVGNQFKHSSTLEHLFYTFYISGISRACLQELARHRLASLSVKSSRYTIKELKDEEPFVKFDDRAMGYLVATGDDMVDDMSLKALENLRLVLNDGISNDKAKYCMPESYKTELTWSINARSLQNFLNLRTNKAALWEIQELAHNIYKNLPDTHKYLFEDMINE